MTSPLGVPKDCPRHSVLDGLFPEIRSESERPYNLNRGVIFFTARVHGAETPSSVMIEALMQLLLQDGDTMAEDLLSRFVFVFIPMVNPDGVHRGYHKLDALGQDLNRCYGSETSQ